MTGYLLLSARVFGWLFLAPAAGRWFSIAETFHQMVAMGVRAVPMAALTAFSIGFTLAMQSSTELGKLGATTFVPDLVSVALMRELGPVLIAVIVIGRSASAITAELGTMKVSEEIEALEVMAVNPVRFLVAPRVAAMLFMLPALTVFGNYLGMVGGWTVCVAFLHFSTASYIAHAIEAATTWDLATGIIKSGVFAWLIATIACHQGLETEGGAAGVGSATTRSVVTSLIVMLGANAVLTALFFFAE